MGRFPGLVKLVPVTGSNVRFCLKKKEKVYYSAIKKNGFMKFLAKWMDLEGIILSEVTQSQKNSHHMHSLLSGY